MCEHMFVRWESQEVQNEDQGRLPGYSDGAVVRTFDAPEALDTRFYEVRAKSALNRVPKASRMPFPWTINPYRGCSHACTYCVWGDVPVLLADGRTRKIADLRVGDAVIGTERRGHYRRYVRTEVLDHWSTIKSVWIVKLEDGTRILTSGDHRFLSNRGWKHVTNSARSAPDRPHLTTNNKLLGTGHFATAPKHCAAYRRGYLCGLIRGDGQLRTYHYTHGSGRRTTVHGFRLALTDFEALRRAHRFLDESDVSTVEFVFAEAIGNHRAVRGIRTGARQKVEAIRQIIKWPWQPNNAWRKGFLAGIFDAEGSCSGAEALRIANTDGTIVHWTQACLEHFGFDTTVEQSTRPNKHRVVRIRGGLRERLRFFHLTDPAITRKRTIEGVALKSDAKTGVVSVEPLGMELPLYDITTGTGDFIADGVVSHNCFARPTHEYLDLNAGRDFEREIVVKVNVPEVLRAELARPSWKGEHIALGTNTDPYQWVEGRYKLMRGIWEAMRDFANPCSILTKSPLVLRDADLLLEIAQRARVSACLSVPTLDEKAWRATEPHTPHPRARLEAVAELNRQGIPTGILIAPLMPGINDGPGQVERIVELAEQAGATSIGGQALFLRGSTRDVFFDWLRAKRPDLVGRYEQLYRNGAYVPAAERRAIEARLPGRRREQLQERFDRPPRRQQAPERPLEAVRQATLF
ncbi:MAG: radical SAM protein [Actinomycetota bacterium]|nr:radical SAM protein [Actinomycetota bacterium]